MSLHTGSFPTIPARRLLQLQSRSVVPGAPVVTAFRDGQVVARTLRRADGFTEADKYIGYQGVEPGDLVVHSMDGFAGAIGVSESWGQMSPVVHIYRGFETRTDLRFVCYYLRNLASAGVIAAMAKGIRERSTSFDRATLAELPIPAPPMSIQRRIADFLDDQTARIDKIIAARSNELSNLSAMIDAQIDETLWQSYPSLPVKFLLASVTSGPRGWGNLVGDSGCPFYRIGNLPKRGIELDLSGIVRVDGINSTESRRAAVHPGDILLGITAALGDVALVGDSDAPAYFSQHVARIRPHVDRVDPEWLAWVLQTPTSRDALTHDGYGGTKIGLGLAEVSNARVPQIGLDEQRHNASAARSIWSNAKHLEEVLARSVARLAEFKRSLITAAVTGEFDVTSADGSQVAARVATGTFSGVGA